MQKSISQKKSNTVIEFILIVGSIIVIGFIAGLLSGANAGYTAFVRPPLTPPDWVFGVVWPILYFMMGVSMFNAVQKYKNGEIDKQSFVAFTITFISQYALNILWPFVFFSMQSPILSAIIIAVLDGLVLTLIVMAFRKNKASALLLIPYFLWLCFATYLNLYIAILN